MPRNGTGIYTLPDGNPVEVFTPIEAAWANPTMSDIATALTGSVAADGQTTPTANLPMGGYRHTNVGSPTSRNQYASLGMVQDGLHIRMQDVVGATNVTGTLIGGSTSYVAGAIVSWFAVGGNSGPMTLAYNGLTPKSLLTADGEQLVAGQVDSGDFCVAMYDGTSFRFSSNIDPVVEGEIYALRTTGQIRPGGGTYSPLTIASPTSINVPAGTANIVAPNSDNLDDISPVSWGAQVVNLSYLASAFSTTIVVDSTGMIGQIAGKASGSALRNSAVLGVVQHMDGTASSIYTRPAIYGDDLYKLSDAATLLANSIISGGVVTANGGAPLQMDVTAGSAFSPGASSDTLDAPNYLTIPGATGVAFRTLAGQSTVGGSLIVNAPVTQYDPNGAGVVTTIPNNADTVVHRLYFLYGQFIWVFGQYTYSSVENAMSLLEYDRTRFKPSLRLGDAILLAEIVATKNTTTLNAVATGIIVAAGNVNFNIGSPGGLSEAPINGTPYGRQDAGWASVVGSNSPDFTNDIKVTGAAPAANMVMNPYAPGTVAYTVWANLFKWFALEVVNPDDKAYLRSYNPASGLLRNSITYDLVAGTLAAAGFVGPLTGNASSATNATNATNASQLGGVAAANFPQSTTVDNFVVSATAPPGGTPNTTVTFVTV